MKSIALLVSVVFVLLCVDVVLKEDLDGVVHFGVNVFAQDAADDRNALFIVSSLIFDGISNNTHSKTKRGKCCNSVLPLVSFSSSSLETS
jgi:hypothetical protein